MFIDTHVQLNFADFDEDLPMVLGNAKKVGVQQFIVPGVDHVSCRRAAHLAHEYPGVIYAAVGFHPYEAPKNPDLSYLETLLKDPDNNGNIVALGEFGLDYHLYKGEMAAGRKDVQQILLESQLRLAITYDMPVIIHCRDAFDDLFTVISRLPKVPRGVLHCFSGSLQDIRTAEQYGFYMGVDGNVTYSKTLMATVPHIPLSRLLLETDAPYLPPEPHRGKRNEPKYIPLIAAKVAELQNKSISDIMEATTANARELFNI